jgi:hypothetical protein
VTFRVIFPALSCTEPFAFWTAPFASKLRFFVALPTVFFTLPAALFALPLACVFPPAIPSTSDLERTLARFEPNLWNQDLVPSAASTTPARAARQQQRYAKKQDEQWKSTGELIDPERSDK